MSKRILAIVLVVLLAAMLAPSLASAAAVTLSLDRSTARPGDTVVASGTADANTFVTLKGVPRLDDGSLEAVVVLDGVKSDAQGNYKAIFKVPNINSNVLIIVAGYGNNVANRTLTVSDGGGSGGSGGGVSSSQAVDSAAGTASLSPGAGGKVSFGSEVSLEIPAGALSGTAGIKVAITKVSDPPASPGGFSLLSPVFEFTVDGNASYSFNKPVTLTFTFDPGDLAEGETPMVHYYDETTGRWAGLNGAVSGSTVAVTVDHFTKFAVLVREATPPAEQTTTVFEQLFSDVPESFWADEAIYKLSRLGAINGYPDGAFRPDNKITRAEFATVLVKAFQLPAASGKVFDDTAGHWAGDCIGAAHAAGIVSGYSENSFGPDDPITREQMAVMIAGAADLEKAAGEFTFTDGDRVSHWARGAVASVTQAGIMRGYPDGSFAPSNEATRAEAVTVIVNAL